MCVDAFSKAKKKTWEELSKMKKYLYALILFMPLVLASGLSAQQKTILKLWRLPDPSRGDIFTQVDIAINQAFREKYPNIELRAATGVSIKEMNEDAQPLLAIAGGVSPDIIYVNFRQSDTYIRQGFLYPMDEFMGNIPKQQLDRRIMRPVWPVIKRQGPKGNVHVWAIPYRFLVRALLCRKDMFYRFGLDPYRPPRTWEELLDYARRLTQPKEGTFGMRLSVYGYSWLEFLHGAGGEVVRQDEKGQWRAAFNTEAGVTSVDYFIKLTTEEWKDNTGKVHHGYTGAMDADIQAAVRDGKIGMLLTYLDDKTLSGNIDMNQFTVAPFPLGPTGKRRSEINCMMMGIFSGAGISNNSKLGPRDPKAVRDAAWKYIWFIDSEAARRIRVRMLVQAGYAKVVNPILLKRYGYSSYLKYTDPNWLKTFTLALETGKPEPYGKNCQMVYKFMTIPLERCASLAEKGELGKTQAERRQIIKKVLDEEADRMNREMIGYIPPDERRFRNTIAIIVSICLVAIFSIVLWQVWKIFTPKDASGASKGWGLFKYRWAYLLLLPALGSILIWKYVPMLMGTAISFQDYSLVGLSKWVGIQNIADVLFDTEWWASVGKTLYYMLLMLTIGFFPPIFLAILLQEVSHGKVLYRVIFYLPTIITGIIVVYLWKLMYDPSDAGALNKILAVVGIPKQRWLKDEALAMICCVIPTVWASIGPGCLIYLAALKSIPDDNYEAADIDGANFFNKIFHVVLPRLKGLIIIQFINAFIAASQQSGFILVMTFGGPNRATKVAGLAIFEKAYLYLKFGTATTMAWILGIMLMGFTVFQLKRMSNMEFKAGGK
jgi:ABC-type sugar transport system permease subunit/ABC-type glycerol-3-phosphate transport system substrate-binding protein